MFSGRLTKSFIAVMIFLLASVEVGPVNQALAQGELENVCALANSTWQNSCSQLSEQVALDVPCMGKTLNLQVEGIWITQVVGGPNDVRGYTVVSTSSGAIGTTSNGQTYAVSITRSQLLNYARPDTISYTLTTIMGNGLVFVSYDADGIITQLSDDGNFALVAYVGQPEPMCAFSPPQ